jgi:hypothetical protein
MRYVGENIKRIKMKKPLDEIKQLFENKSYLIRGEFINDYDFDDDYHEYYRQFILNAKSIRNHLYLSDLIDLSGWLGLYDEALQIRWFSYLFKPNHYVVKLAVLDYFKYCEKKKAGLSYEKKLKALLKERLLQIVRAQVLFNLIRLNTKESMEFVDDLNALLSRTNDWRIYYRIMNNLKEVRINNKYKQAILRELTISVKEGKLNKEMVRLLEEVV